MFCFAWFLLLFNFLLLVKFLETFLLLKILTTERYYIITRTTDTQWRHISKISEKLVRCGRQNMLRPYLKIWEWEWIFGRSVKAISSLGVRSLWSARSQICKNIFQIAKLRDQEQIVIRIFLEIWQTILSEKKQPWAVAKASSSYARDKHLWD